MTDSNNVSNTIDQMVMSSPASLSITADRVTGETAITSLPTARSQVASSSGDVVPASEFTAASATEQHLKLNDAIAGIDAQLNAQIFDSNTGQPTGFKLTDARDRELLQLQRQSYQRAIDYLGQRALEQLPKRAERAGASEDALVAQAQRMQNINALAESQNISRVEATRLVDEASKRAAADRLVRGR